jgi:phosphoglycolate phosphatase-like HAD superfamily hydrolase
MMADSAAGAASAGNSLSATTSRAVIFDIGSVIVRVNLGRALAVVGASAGAGQSPEQMWAAIQADPLWDDWQKGKIGPHEWHRHLSQKFGTTLDFDVFCDAWNRRCRLALLSNTDVIHVAYMEKNFSFMQYFPVRIYSCRVGVCKPAPEIYLRALQEVGVSAGEALYIDDIEENVQAARKIGMLALRFTGVDPLYDALRRLKLLTT